MDRENYTGMTIYDFKQCPLCNYVWRSRQDFLSDPAIELAGYEVNFKDLDCGWFIFDHSCTEAFKIRSGKFRDLYDGPIFSEPLTGTDECRMYCLHKDELGHCPARCECAYVREIILVIRAWPKESVHNAG